MPKLKEVCRHVESKVAGPFWVTIDVRFDGQEDFDRYVDSPALSSESIGRVYGVDPGTVSFYPIPKLGILKISYPRRTPAGGIEERDLHSGQQYAYLLDLEV